MRIASLAAQVLGVRLTKTEDRGYYKPIIKSAGDERLMPTLSSPPVNNKKVTKKQIKKLNRTESSNSVLPSSKSSICSLQ